MRVAIHVVVIACVAAVLAGCAAGTSIDGATSTRFQTSVVSIAGSASSGDPATALAQLEELESALQLALDEGRVSSQRGAEIAAAIDLVRADLTAAIEAIPAPEPPAPTPGDDKGNGKGNDNDKGKGNKD